MFDDILLKRACQEEVMGSGGDQHGGLFTEPTRGDNFGGCSLLAWSCSVKRVDSMSTEVGHLTTVRFPMLNRAFASLD